MKELFEKFDLSGKTALITGAAGLLGIEHAEALLESGATVVLTDVGSESLKSASARLSRNAKSSRILTRLMDVTKPDEVKGVADELEVSGLRVDILINNAVIDPKVRANKGIEETSD